MLTIKIDDVLTKHGGLLHVLPLTVHLKLSYSVSFFVGPGWVAHVILVSASVLLRPFWVVNWVCLGWDWA